MREREENRKETAKRISRGNRRWQTINDMETKYEINNPQYNKEIKDAVRKNLEDGARKQKIQI